MARRSGKQKLIGWGVFAAVAVVIVAVFLVTRLVAEVPAPAVANATATPTATNSLPAAPADPTPSSSLAVEPAAASVAAAAPSSQVPAPPAPVVDVVDAGTMSQQSRRDLLLTLIQQGVFTGVQAVGSPPRVGVTALFRGLSPGLQQQFIAVVYAYINNGAAGTQTLQLIDAASGSQVGSYSASDGLKLG